MGIRFLILRWFPDVTPLQPRPALVSLKWIARLTDLFICLRLDLDRISHPPPPWPSRRSRPTLGDLLRKGPALRSTNDSTQFANTRPPRGGRCLALPQAWLHP